MAAERSTGLIEQIIGITDNTDSFVAVKTSIEVGKCDSVLILHKQLYSHSPMGHISRYRILIAKNGEYTVRIIFG